MIEYIEGDIFDSPAQVIVNPVNTVGVMGKGLALSFKQRYPDMFQAYRTACEKHQLAVGKLMLWYAPDHWLLLFPTKENWRNPSKLEYIEKGLMKFTNEYANKNITSVAFPKLGCGNGELDWAVVKPVMEKYLKSLPIDVYIYLGLQTASIPEHRTPKKTMEWMKQDAKDMSFNGIKDDIVFNSQLVPFSFSASDNIWEVCWDNGPVFRCEAQASELYITEEAFFEIWDEIRSQGVFRTPKDDFQRSLIYSMLCALGYLSSIRIKDNKTNAMVEGYQINEGSGRLFSLKGER